MKLDQIKNSWTEVVRNRSLHSNSDPYVETGDAPADAAVFAMVVLLVNLQNNIIPSTTNQMISRNNLPMVASEKKNHLTSSSKNLHVLQKYSPMQTPQLQHTWATWKTGRKKMTKKIWISWIRRENSWFAVATLPQPTTRIQSSPVPHANDSMRRPVPY